MFKSNVLVTLAFITLCHIIIITYGRKVYKIGDYPTTGEILNNLTSNSHDVSKNCHEYPAFEEDQPLRLTKLLEQQLVITLENPDLTKMKKSTDNKPTDTSEDKSEQRLNDDGRYNITFQEKAREDSFNLTKASENPYVVLLVAKAGSKMVGICSGSLITMEWVLTAGHCVNSETYQLDTILVYAGGNSFTEIRENKPAKGSQIRESSTFFAHPSFSDSSHDSDIGLVKVNPQFDIHETVNTVKISTQPWTYHSYYKCTFTGFGKVYLNKKSDDDSTRKTTLLELKQPCLCSFMIRIILGAEKVHRYICSRPREDYGVCPGDSGGGLVCDGEVKAVAMQMLIMNNMATCDISEFGSITNFECGSRNTLSVFEDTCPFLRWINQHVQLFNDSQISTNCVDSGGQQSLSFYTCEPLILALFIMYIFACLKAH